ncbi:MAG: helix-turn-helix transcriptional regulator [Pseudomonadota bacterium]
MAEVASLDVAFVIIDTIALSLLIVIAFGFLVSAPRTAVAWLVLLIVINYTAYILSARQDYAYAVPLPLQIDFGQTYWLINLARNSISWVLMLLAHTLFREKQALPRILLVLIVIQLFLEEPLAWILGSEWATSHVVGTFLLYEVAPACLQITFSLLAFYWAISDRRFDLVESRRAARVLLLILVGVQGLVSLLVERMGFLAGLIPFQLMYPVHMFLVSLQTLMFGFIVFWLLRRDLLEFLENAPQAERNRVDDEDTSLQEVERIRAAFEQDMIYHQMGLTVTDLARHVGMPEYRLRKLILNNLGYKNFNSLLHQYRVEEVARCLEDPAQNQTPILTLALSAGYQSINPFNRAFKELKHVTPSEYRLSSQKTG